MINRNILGLLAFTYWSTAPNFAAADEFLLICRNDEQGTDQRLILIDQDTRIVRLVDSIPERIGTVDITDNAYIVSLPADQPKFSEGRIIINRYTGNAEFEFGTPPFGEVNLGNVFSTRVCEVGVAQQKF